MVLPLLTSLEVRLTPRSLYLRNEKLERMVRDDGRIPVPYNVSIRNAGDGAVRIIGKKWTVRSHGDGTQIIEGDELFGSRPLLCQGQIFAFNMASLGAVIWMKQVILWQKFRHLW